MTGAATEIACLAFVLVRKTHQRWRDLLLRLLQRLLQIEEERFICGAIDERSSNTRLASTTCAADAVNVVLCIVERRRGVGR